MASKGASALTGAGTGAATGAAVGSVIPGIGTAIGAGVGAIGGGLIGYLSGSDESSAPNYNPNPQNFQLSLGQWTDAQGVVHPTPEERAQMSAQAKAQNQQEQQRLDALLGELDAQGAPANDPRRKLIEQRILQVVSDGDKQQQEIATRGGVDTYAAQRVRETIGKQNEIYGVGADAYNRQAPQQGMVTSQGQQYLQNADVGRGNQLQTLEALQAFAAQGEGPSAAQAQLQAGTDMAARQQYGMARSQPGGGGAALRNAAFNAAGISGNAANSAAALRAQETANYRNTQLAALGQSQQAATGMRGADQAYALAQANQANTDANLAFNVGQNNLNAQLQNRAQGDQTWLNTVGIGAQYDQQRDALAGMQQNSGAQLEQARAAGAGINSGNWATQEGLNRQDLSMGLNAAGTGAAALATAFGGNDDARRTGLASGAEANRASIAASDERRKTNVHRADALSAALETVGNAPGYSYRYKDPGQPGAKPGRQYGPMAQDLERGPLGDTLVKDTPNGKMVDTGRVAMMGASAITELNHRLEALEHALGKRSAA